MIGGLITSTLLTLLLVPTLYAMVELRKERRARKRQAKRDKKAGVTAEPTPTASLDSDEPETAGV